MFASRAAFFLVAAEFACGSKKGAPAQVGAAGAAARWRGSRRNDLSSLPATHLSQVLYHSFRKVQGGAPQYTLPSFFPAVEHAGCAVKGRSSHPAHVIVAWFAPRRGMRNVCRSKTCQQDIPEVHSCGQRLVDLSPAGSATLIGLSPSWGQAASLSTAYCLQE